jgi:hypothetical protein
MASSDDLYWAPSPNRFRQSVQPVLNIPSRAEEERRRAMEMLGVPERSVTRETRYSGFLDPLYEGLETAGLNVAGGARWLASPVTGALRSLWDEPVSAQIQLGTDVDKETADYIAAMSSMALPGIGVGGPLLSGAVKAGKVAKGSMFPHKSEIFDLSAPFPDYPQFAIPHVLHKSEKARKAAEDKWELVSRPDNVKRMIRLFDKGAKEGGLSWYNTEPIRLKFIDEFGPEMGNNLFAKFMQLVASSSPKTSVTEDIRIAMTVYGRMMRASEKGHSVNLSGIPGLMERTHGPAIKDVLAATDMSPAQGLTAATEYGARPKVVRFGENLRGNLEPIAVDTHNLKALLEGQDLPTGFKPPFYRYAELPQQKMAQQVDVPPAQFQSSVWVGAEDLTGVRDPRPFIQVLEDRIKMNAELSGIKPEKWFKKWMRGEVPVVYSMGPAAMTGGSLAIANQLFEKEDTL